MSSALGHGKIVDFQVEARRGGRVTMNRRSTRAHASFAIFRHETTPTRTIAASLGFAIAGVLAYVLWRRRR